ncbi:MAG: TlyA family RNA methyltransferase, partial [Helicobacter sp.]|nr:TlyA family RNA methyltransferase [Helicobacter sp.]
SDQLHYTLRTNSKIKLFEKTDIKNFLPISPFESYDIVVCDVSFVSFFNIFKSFKTLIKKWLILLFKPQFEVGKEVKRNKKGVVLEENKIKQVLQNTLDFLSYEGFEIFACEKSKITGKEGNEEFFIACKRH